MIKPEAISSTEMTDRSPRPRQSGHGSGRDFGLTLMQAQTEREDHGALASYERNSRKSEAPADQALPPAQPTPDMLAVNSLASLSRSPASTPVAEPLGLPSTSPPLHVRANGLSVPDVSMPGVSTGEAMTHTGHAAAVSRELITVISHETHLARGGAGANRTHSLIIGGLLGEPGHAQPPKSAASISPFPMPPFAMSALPASPKGSQTAGMPAQSMKADLMATDSSPTFMTPVVAPATLVDQVFSAIVSTSSGKASEPDAQSMSAPRATHTAMQDAPVRVLRLQLAPESLGLVNIYVAGHGAAVRIRLEAERPDTASRLETDLGTLVNRLTSLGATVSELAILRPGSSDSATASPGNEGADTSHVGSAARNESEGSGRHNARPPPGDDPRQHPGYSEHAAAKAEPEASRPDTLAAASGRRLLRTV